MTDKEVAMQIILKDEKIIQDKLLVNGYMFDDDFSDTYIASPVVRELASCIEQYFKLEDELYVIREEMNTRERSDGVFFFSGCGISLTEARELAKQHYNMK